MNELVFWALTALICQGQSLHCNCPDAGIPAPILPVPLPTPVITAPINSCCQQPIIVPPPIISTTIVDNSVANSLANTLQLLIVSHLIENSLNPPIYTSPYLPTCDSVPSIGGIDVISPAVDISYTPIDIVPINYGPVVDVSTNVVTEVITPTVYGGVTEIVPAPISTGICCPNVYAPVTEVIAPIVPDIDVFTSITEVVNPVISIAPPVSINPYYGVPDMIHPFSQGYVTEVTESVGPREFINSIPPYFGGCNEMYNPIPPGVPFAAEVIFPQSIPAQLKCNFGYGLTPQPLVSVEAIPLVEPYPFYY